MVPQPASVDRVAAHAARVPWRCSPGLSGTAVTEGVAAVQSTIDEGGRYGSCLHPLQASHLVGPSREAYRPRMAAYSTLPKAVDATNRPRRAAVAGGHRTAQKAAAMTTQPGRCCCGHLYFERGGTSSYYCPEGNRLLCEECAARGAGVCPTHKIPCTWRQRSTLAPCRDRPLSRTILEQLRRELLLWRWRHTIPRQWKPPLSGWSWNREPTRRERGRDEP